MITEDDDEVCIFSLLESFCGYILVEGWGDWCGEGGLHSEKNIKSWCEK